MSIELTVISTDLDNSTAPEVKTFKQRELFLGRDEENDMILNLPEVSGVHAKLIARNCEQSGRTILFIQDLGSSNGTFVDNAQVPPNMEYEVYPNQRIRIGRFMVKPVLPDDDFDDYEKQEELAEVDELEMPSPELIEETSSRSLFGRFRNRSAQSEQVEEIKNPMLEEQGGMFTAEPVEDLDPELETKGNGRHPTEISLTSLPEEAPEAPLAEPLKEREHTILTKRPAPKPKLTPKTESGFSAKLKSFGASITGTVQNQNLEDINFEALRLLALSGRLMHQDESLADVEIDAGELGKTITDADGRFEFSDIAEGSEYTIAAHKEGYSIACNEDSGILDDNTSLEFDILKLYSISGRVLHKGVPVEGFEIDGGEFGKATTDKDGVYTFHSIPEGKEFNLSAAKEGFLVRADTEIED